MGRYRRKREAKADAGRGSSKRSWRRGPFSPLLSRLCVLCAWPSSISKRRATCQSPFSPPASATSLSYAAASTTEKVSRNRHGLDADGNPISGAAGHHTNTTTSDKEAKG